MLHGIGASLVLRVAMATHVLPLATCTYIGQGSDFFNNKRYLTRTIMLVESLGCSNVVDIINALLQRTCCYSRTPSEVV